MAQLAVQVSLWCLSPHLGLSSSLGWVCEEVKESKLAYLCVLTGFLSVNSL